MVFAPRGEGGGLVRDWGYGVYIFLEILTRKC